MSKNTNEQGETKSRPPEIKKLARNTCGTCGLSGPSPMVVKGRCGNAVACAKRVRRTAQKTQ